MFPGGMGGMGRSLALNQLLVVMDGIGDPPFWRRFWTNRINTFLDASYVVPRRVGERRCGCRARKPRTEQIFFVGACNVPLEVLDPALTRPGRMGRHVWFRTPTKQDRLDVFNLYLGKVAHDPELDTDEAPRGARADHERLLAGDDRAGLLDGADDRPLRPARALRLGGHRRRDDLDRVRHRDQPGVRRRGDAGRRHPRGGSRGLPRTCT